MALGLPLLLPLLAGCPQYNWIGDVQQAEQKARAENRIMFVYYKYYLDSTSNRMLGNELSDPEVVKLFQDTVNLLLDRHFGPHKDYVATRFKVEEYPSSILVGPDGSYKVITGEVAKDRLIDWVQRSKLAVGGAPGAASKP